VQRSGQDHVGRVGGLVQKEVDRHIKLQLLKHASDKVVVRQLDDRVESQAKKPLDLAAVDLA
jgi:hypothetical protein